MVRHNSYQDLKGRQYDLTALDKEEQKLVADLRQRADRHPDWNEFENYWISTVAGFYDARGLKRTESRHTVAYQIGQDLSGRIAVAAGLARLPDYRDELEEIVRTQFPTRRAFCEATGLSEDMLSHVLARRKHLAADTLTQALSRIGYTLRIVPSVGLGTRNGSQPGADKSGKAR